MLQDIRNFGREFNSRRVHQLKERVENMTCLDWFFLAIAVAAMIGISVILALIIEKKR